MKATETLASLHWMAQKSRKSIGPGVKGLVECLRPTAWVGWAARCLKEWVHHLFLAPRINPPALETLGVGVAGVRTAFMPFWSQKCNKSIESEGGACVSGMMTRSWVCWLMIRLAAGPQTVRFWRYTFLSAKEWLAACLVLPTLQSLAL